MRVADEVHVAHSGLNLVSGALVGAKEVLMKRNQVVSLIGVNYNWWFNPGVIRKLEMSLSTDIEYLDTVIGYIFGGRKPNELGTHRWYEHYIIGGGEAWLTWGHMAIDKPLYGVVVPAQLILLGAQTNATIECNISCEVYYREVDMGRNEVASLYNRWTRSRN